MFISSWNLPIELYTKYPAAGILLNFQLKFAAFEDEPSAEIANKNNLIPLVVLQSRTDSDLTLLQAITQSPNWSRS